MITRCKRPATHTGTPRHAGSLLILVRNALLITFFLALCQPASRPANAQEAAPAALRKPSTAQVTGPKAVFAACPKGVPRQATCGTLSFHGLLNTPTQPTIQVSGQMGRRTIALLTVAN